MEKLKNLVNPGSKKDDEVMYGSGRSDDPVHTGSTNMGNTKSGSAGAGSHFGSSRTAGHDPLSTSSNPTGTSQYDSPVPGGASHGLSEPYASRMPGGFDNDDAATTASVSSGVPGQSQSRSTMTCANDPTFTDKPLPREPASATGHEHSSLTGNSYPDRSVGSSHRHGEQSSSSHLGRDAALGAAAVGTSTHRHEDPQRDNYAPETGRSFPLGGSSASDGYGSTTSGPRSSNLANKADPRVDSDGSQTTANAGYGSASGGYGTTTSGPHSSNLANKADPRVDSDGSRTTANAGYGSTSGGYGATTSGPHSSNLANKADPRVDSDGTRTTANVGYGSTSGGYGSGTGATPSLGNQGSLGRDALATGAGAVGSGTTANTGYGPESWQHEHQKHGHQYDGDSCNTAAVGTREGPHFVSGPHATDTANRLDPHVNSGNGGAGATGDSGRHDHHGHRGEEAALVGGAGGAGLGALEADRNKRGSTGNNTSSGLDSSKIGHHGIDTTGAGTYDNDRGTSLGASSTGRTAGPHKSDMLNKLDPLVDSDLSKQQGSHGGDHNYGRDAALTGASGAGLYEAEKHHRGNQANPATSSTTSGVSGSQGRDHHIGRDAALTGASGAGLYEAEKHHRGNQANPATSSTTSGISGSQGRDHHIGRDAALTGASGAGLYEAEKHHRGNESNLAASTTTSGVGGQSPYGSEVDPRIDSARSGMSRDQSAISSAGSGHQHHQYKRDAGLVGAGGLGAYEAEKRIGSSNRSDLAATPQDQLAGSGHQPATATGSSPYPSSGYGSGSQPQSGYDTEKGHHTGHHTGRDAALVGGAGIGAGALAGHEHSQRDTAGYGNEPYQNTPQAHHTGRDTAALGGTGAGIGALASNERSQRDATSYGTEPLQDTSRKHHTGRDAAIVGGAAGAGGLAEHEYSKKDAEKLQKEHVKEEKALEKEHSKEVKHHNKELAKEEKAHEKAIENSEKKHEKAIEKDEKKQEHGEKKHGGLLGFLHRDKPDKELKDEEARRQAATHPGRGEEMAAGAGATGPETRGGYDPLQGEHGSQSGVHDTPIGIGSGPTTHDAYGAHDSGHNKLHKDPPAKVLESRGYEFQ